MINWGLGHGSGFQNALATGMHMGQQARQAQDQRETRNALAEYAANPTKEGVAKIAAHSPQFAMQEGARYRAEEAEQQTARLTQRAMGGDPEAMKQLATVNFDRWKALDGQQKDAAKQEAELFGNAAMDILNRPADQRGAAVQAYAQQLGPQYPEIAQIAQLPPAQLETALRSAVAEAGMVKQLIEMERPNYMVVPYDSTIVNERDPAALAQFGQGAQQSGIQEGATATNPQTGQKIVFRDGQWQPVGGGGGNVTSNFLDGF